jgi:alpha-ketoglutarate-dependent taurine dioxygenase
MERGAAPVPRVIVRPLESAPFGAEVELAMDVTELHRDEAAELREALARHQLLVFHTDLNEDDHQVLVSSFGRLLPQGPRVIVNDHPQGPFPIVTYVSNVKPGGGLGTFELSFHQDLAHVATPLAGLSLYAVDVAPGQAATRFASGRLAYDRLSLEEQYDLERLQAIFVGNYTTTTNEAEASREALRQLDPTWPRAVHPVTVPHPITGKRCVYVNEMQVAQIVGLDTAVGDKLLDWLFAVLYDPADVYEHHWRNGDLVVWDNLSVQHARRAVDEHTPRTLRRVVFGALAPWEQWPWHSEQRADVAVGN